MEYIVKLIESSLSGGFCRFIGYFLMVAIIINLPVRLLYILINRPLRHWNIRKHGYPPAHCDADGDFKPEKDEDD